MGRRPLMFVTIFEQGQATKAAAEKAEIESQCYPSMIVPQQGKRAKFEDFTTFRSGFC